MLSLNHPVKNVTHENPPQALYYIIFINFVPSIEILITRLTFHHLWRKHMGAFFFTA